MAIEKGSITLRGRFADGTKVEVFERRGDTLPADTSQLGTAVKSGTPKDGELELDGLVPGGSYWAVQVVDGERRSANFVAHNQDRSDVPVVAPSGQTDPVFGEQVRPAPHPGEVVTGARGSSVAKATEARNEQSRALTGKQEAHEPTARGDLSVEQHPFRKVSDVDGPKRSDTPMGEGHPVDKDESNPGVRQEDFEGWQRSDTPHGTATPVEPDEVQPAERQEDSGKALQRSDTRTGSQELIADQSVPPDPTKPAEEVKAKPAPSTQRKSSTTKKPAAKKKGGKR